MERVKLSVRRLVVVRALRVLAKRVDQVIGLIAIKTVNVESGTVLVVRYHVDVFQRVLRFASLERFESFLGLFAACGTTCGL